ncbi:hypothetical protein BCR42DRAFT_477692 [Absidia repens]|uniref:PQ loop repeat-domain-containing protein n=1 Tax=Absidia repens TaxID=90262 RepID=A0A1X2ILA7_9FUNG|nr:hypothetical protein BCR42DRAFT_477692 [Absidia repens]
MSTPLETSTTDSQVCKPHHDSSSLYVSGFLCIGVVISYLPQHYRIISNKTSEGFSPWFLLLGVVSSTSSFFNIILLQWNTIMCCHSLTTGACLESLMGVFQTALQFAMFSLVFILFLVYFPEGRKRIWQRPSAFSICKPIKQSGTISEEWRISIIVAILGLGHLTVSFIISFVMLIIEGGPDHHRWTKLWAGFLGVLSMVMAAMQYFPQIYKTWKRKSIGALSIPMMMLQTPGTGLFVYSLMVRPGTNWTAWITYLVTGILQSILLSLCIVWHLRNKRLGIKNLEDPPMRSSNESSRLI